MRRQVRKRLARRMAALGIGELHDYRAFLQKETEEWQVLDSLCWITISRFYRDRGIFDALRSTVLPELARGALARRETELRAWSAGCASGEEPYTLALIFWLELMARYPGLGLRITATDASARLLERARRGVYPPGSLRELPAPWIERAFAEHPDGLELGATFRAAVTFCQQDIRRQLPAGPFHLILCRNLALTYFDIEAQRAVLAELEQRLRPGGILVVGCHEGLPEGVAGLAPLGRGWPFYRRVGRF